MYAYRTNRFKPGRTHTPRLSADERNAEGVVDCGRRVEPILDEDDDADNAFRGRNPNAESDLVEMICGLRY